MDQRLDQRSSLVISAFLLLITAGCNYPGSLPTPTQVPIVIATRAPSTASPSLTQPIVEVEVPTLPVPTGISPAAPAISTGVDLVATLQTSDPDEPPEYAVTEIPLAGPVSAAEAEISGLGWYDDLLLLLPQFPNRFPQSSSDGAIFAIRRAELLAFLDGSLAGPLSPQAIPLQTNGLESRISGFEGFEAIAVIGEQVYLAIEAHDGAPMVGYLVMGTIEPDLTQIRLDPATLTKNTLQANWRNRADEALLTLDGSLASIYESNGAGINPDPKIHMFSPSLQMEGTLPFPSLEYRVTDATSPGRDGNFWVINFFFPGDTEQTVPSEPLAERWGRGFSHATSLQVERLLHMHYEPGLGASLLDEPPVQLKLDVLPRNWEGLALLEGRGFLIATDKFPGTLLGFVAYPDEDAH